MDSQVRQTYFAMFLVITGIVGFIHGMAILPLALAVDCEECQKAVDVLTLPASLFADRIRQLPEGLNLITFGLLGPGLWDMTIAALLMYFVRRQTLGIRDHQNKS